MSNIYDKYFYKIYNWALGKTRNKEDAEDITDKISDLITRAKYSVITYYYDELFNRTVDEYLNDKKISEEKTDTIIEILKNYYVGVLFTK